MNCVLGPDNILYDTVLFRVIYDFVGNVLPCWLSYAVTGVVIMFMLVNAVLLGAGGFSWVERRLIGRFHNRVGPNRWGPFGMLQPMADVVKLIFKEDLTPRGADRIVFTIVPVAMLAPVILMMAVVPFAKDTALANLNVGVLYILAVTSITSIAIFMAGWASNNMYAMFGASRGVAVLISYEVPVVMSLLGVVLVAGSMSMDDVVSAQTVPFLLVQPLAFFVFLTGTSAELNRTPFDMAEAESEIIAGYHIEYSGVKFALIQAAEFGAVLTSSAVMVTLFLSGWSGPVSNYLGWVWFLLKIGVLAFIFSWVRATFPRLRIDQLLAFAWKFLLPLSIINLFATALEVYFLRDASGTLDTSDLWIMAGINFGVAFACLIIFGTLIKEKVQPAGTATGASLVSSEAD
ncbi:MAG TPA: NADH-quinone oxidoreductase subunit NuoH [Dehalococcoidia bacterium]|nr:NADH-quinone oxidoreductase subunit NuoH [Dehalococcoidia bacterium]